jgi:signal peptidase II
VAPRARLALWLFAVAGAVLTLDRLSKAWVEASLAGRRPLEIIPGLLQLTYTTNSGGAFGLGRSAPWIFAGATIFVSIAIVAASTRLPNRGVAVALGLILGGALGNLADRALNGSGMSGHVTDFIDFRIWPVFNLADSAIVIGAILLAVVTSRRDGSAVQGDGRSGSSPRDEGAQRSPGSTPPQGDVA